MVDQETYHKWNRRETPQGGDLVFTREAPVGEACIIPNNEDVILGQRMMLVRADNSVILNRYLLLWFYSEMAKYQYELNSHGSTVEHLRVKDVPNLQIPVPPLAEQHKIVEQLWADRELDKKFTSHIQDSISLLKEKRQSLITNAVTGQIDVNDHQEQQQDSLA
jgi:type I restriction enzyme S subunit